MRVNQSLCHLVYRESKKSVVCIFSLNCCYLGVVELISRQNVRPIHMYGRINEWNSHLARLVHPND